MKRVLRSKEEIKTDLFNGLQSLKKKLNSISTKKAPVYGSKLGEIGMNPYMFKVILDLGIIKHTGMDKNVKLYSWANGEDGIDPELVDLIHTSAIKLETEAKHKSRGDKIEKKTEKKAKKLAKAEPLHSFENLDTRLKEKEVSESVNSKKECITFTSKQLLFLRKMVVGCNVLLNNIALFQHVSYFAIEKTQHSDVKLLLYDNDEGLFAIVNCTDAVKMSHAKVDNVNTLILTV